MWRGALDAGEDALGSLDGVVNVGIRVLQAGEAGLELRGGEVDALLKHTPVPLGELGRVRLHGLLEVGHGALAEEEAEHARDGAAAHLVASLPARLQDAVDELLGDLVQVLVAARALEDLKRLDAGRHGQGVAR